MKRTEITVRELLIQADQAEARGDKVLANHLIHEAQELAAHNADRLKDVQTNALVAEIWG